MITTDRLRAAAPEILPVNAALFDPPRNAVPRWRCFYSVLHPGGAGITVDVVVQLGVEYGARPDPRGDQCWWAVTEFVRDGATDDEIRAKVADMRRALDDVVCGSAGGCPT